MKVEINEIEHRIEKLEKINEFKSWFFKKLNQIGKPFSVNSQVLLD